MQRILFCLGLLLILASCNKRHTCTCVSDEEGTIVEIHNIEETYVDAENACGTRDNTKGVTCQLD